MDPPLLPPPPEQRAAVLPPGVYFNPTPEEAVHNYLNRWIAGEEIPEVDAGLVVRADVYGDRPDALRRMHLPGHSRNYEHRWFFLSHHKLQSSRRGDSKRVVRGVATGGRWKVEQSMGRLGGDAGGKNSCRFYFPDTVKTSWLMEEYTSSLSDGAARGEDNNMVPVLCKVYLTPRASDDERRALFGEDGVAVGPDGSKKKARVTVPAAWFDAVAARQPVAAPAPGDLGHLDDIAAILGQVAVGAAPAPAELGHHQLCYVTEALPEPGDLGHYRHNGHFVQAALEQDYLDYHRHDVHFTAAPPEQGYLGHDQGHLAAPAPGELGHHHHGHVGDLGHYHQHGHFTEAPPEPEQDYHVYHHDHAHVAEAPPEQGDLCHDQGHFAAAPTPEEFCDILPMYEFSPEMMQMLSMGYTEPNEQLLPQLRDPTGGYDIASSTAAIDEVNVCAAATAAQEAEQTPPTLQIRPNAAAATVRATATAETMPPPLDDVAPELSAPPRGLPSELAFNGFPSAHQETSYDDNNSGELVAEEMLPLILENADARIDEPLPDLAGIVFQFPDSCTLVIPDLDFGRGLMTSSAITIDSEMIWTAI
ncbi:hypothetical protein E2562_014217 [Oryza meyeriana var. granulata]|uniref:NAC domain-containing protein n=1 Tax=Oryza meyeriana var. granulata TaxID=110450 RepID=A0A6G1BKB7_9ORYZ|nr:hypothetical protein E2562_014217 [Oryza meyeriana var. granulata]